MDDFDKEREDLLAKFRESLRNPDSNAFFSENDLAEIFDYAGDNDNDFLRLEALRIGDRYFPDSKLLADRRAILYSEILSYEDMQEYLDVDDATDSLQSSLIKNIIHLASSEQDSETVRSFIESTIKATSDLEDEEIIKLVGLAAMKGCLDWVIKNLGLIKKHVSNHSILLYEVGYRAADLKMYDEASEVLEQLVEALPYTAEYWRKLAEVQSLSTKYQNMASESLEMALAIEPDNDEALLERARTVDDENIESIDILENIAKRLPDDDEPFDHLVSLYIKYDQTKRAIKFIAERLTGGVKDLPTIVALIHFDAEHYYHKIVEYIMEYPDTVCNQELWMGIVDQLATFGSTEAALMVIDCLKQQEQFEYNDQVKLIEAELNFILEDYVGAINILMTGNPAEYKCVASVPVMIAVSLLKTGNAPTAALFTKELKKDCSMFWLDGVSTWRLTGKIAQYGVSAILKDISRKTSGVKGISFDPESYNPFK
jgi:tetratricopeptide (TPR) repeat protein